MKVDFFKSHSTRFLFTYSFVCSFNLEFENSRKSFSPQSYEGLG